MTTHQTLLDAETTRAMLSTLGRLQRVSTFDYPRADAILTQELTASVSHYDGLKSDWCMAHLRGVALAARVWGDQQRDTMALRREAGQ